MVRLGEDRRDDALAERIVKRVVDSRRRDAETRRGGAVDPNIGRKAVLGVVAGDVLELRQLLQALEQFRNPGRELVGIGVLEYKLILGAADRRVDGQILDRLHIERDAGDVLRFPLQPPDHVAGRNTALLARLQINQKPAGIEGCVGAVDPDEGG